MNKTFTKYLSKLRSPKFLIIAGITGILLILLSSLSGGEDNKMSASPTEEFSAEIFSEQLEDDIKNMVAKITGSEDVSVVVTLESGIRYSYADIREETLSDKTESDSASFDSELKENYIIIENADGGQTALLVTAEMPEVRGVAIVCEGGDIETTNEKIKNAVCTALNITSKRVYICGRKQQ